MIRSKYTGRGRQKKIKGKWNVLKMEGKDKGENSNEGKEDFK